MALKKHIVGAVEKAEFLAESTNEQIPANGISPRIFCMSKCNQKRTSANDFRACNNFVMEDGQCKLAFREINWK